VTCGVLHVVCVCGCWIEVGAWAQALRVVAFGSSFGFKPFFPLHIRV